VLGDVPVAGSIVLLLLLGGVAGAALSSFFWWSKQRRVEAMEIAYRERNKDRSALALPDVEALIKSAHTPSFDRQSCLPGEAGVAVGSSPSKSRLPRTAEALASGPLALGASMIGLSLDGTKRPSSSTGNPFAPNLGNSAARKEDAGLIKSSHPSLEADGSPTDLWPLDRSELQSPMAPAPATEGRLARSIECRLSLVNAVELGPTGTTLESSLPVDVETGGGKNADVGGTLDSSLPDAKAAEKQKLVDQVDKESYEAEELTEDWRELLEGVDQKMKAGGHPVMAAGERPLAIRSLLAATAKLSPEDALDKAAEDVLATRLRR
jgi:hypothetical protein